MRIVGHLINAMAPAKRDAFDGYTVRVRYLALAPNTPVRSFNEVSDVFVLRGGDSGFSFDVSEPNQLDLDGSLSISVTSRGGAPAYEEKYSWAKLGNPPAPIEIRIRVVEPAPTLTPLSLRGQLAWRGAPNRINGFDGFKVSVNFQMRDAAGAIYIPQSVATTVAGANRFEAQLPNREMLKEEPLEAMVKYPDGQIAATVSLPLDRLKEQVIIEISPQPTNIVKADDRSEEVKQERIKGKVIDLEGKVQIKNKQVIIWAKRPNGAPRPVVVAVTDGTGGFFGDWPKEAFEGAVATVAGTNNATVEVGAAIDLTQVGGGPPVGQLPKFVYLVVTLPASYATEDDVCGCQDNQALPLPDAEDLVKNPTAYAQDIGANCVNFTTPNRTLEEFTYTMVVRTTDPEIKGTTLSDLDQRKRALDQPYRAMTEAGASSFPEIQPTTLALPTIRALIPGKSVATSSARLNVDAVLPWDWLKTVPGRAELNAQNAVDWDSTPTFYQATTIAHGHVLYFKQIWKAAGYSLGDLVYSLPLAPGQKKQVVIFDWDRTEYGRRDEDRHEDEALDSHLSHNRDVLDITSGRVSEQMRGGSEASTSGSAGGIGGGLFGDFFGVVGGFAASSGHASSSAWQDSSRDVSATGMNQLRDFVQQGASAVRNQRSTVVQTARQTERFKVETEVIANHNHCHAITVQYFEVLRHYAIEQKLTHVQECLFIPLLMAEFDEPKVLRWKNALRSALRDPDRQAPIRIFTARASFQSSYRNRPLSNAFDAIERRQNKYEGADFPDTTYAAEEVLDLTGDLYISLSLNRPRDKQDEQLDEHPWDLDGAGFLGLLGWGFQGDIKAKLDKLNQQERNRFFDDQIAPKIAEAFIDQLKFLAVDKHGAARALSLDTTLISRYQRDAILYVSVRPTQGAFGVTREQIAKLVIYSDFDLSKSENSRIIIRTGTFHYRTRHFDGILYDNSAINNDLKNATLSFSGLNFTIPTDNVALYTPLTAEELRDPKKEDAELSKRLLTHLNANIEYYHKALWSNLDPDRRYMLLDGFVAPNANGKSVASVVENRVIGVAGNSLIMPVAPGYKLDPSYEYQPELDGAGKPRKDDQGRPIFKPINLLDHYAPLTPIPPFRVSVPTRGVFAEAVPGACNACEKIENERFWKWEEHPNPDEPTAISPVQTMPPQRTDPGKLEPTPFPTPMINIQNAPPAPEPGATLAGALGLLGKSGLFPDITGLDQNQKNALQAMLSNQEAAKHFADKAAELVKQNANQRSGDTTVENIKKSIRDGSIDKETGKKLIEDVYRAQISGKTADEKQPSTANHAALIKAGSEAVAQGREVTVGTTDRDGTKTTVEQKAKGIAFGIPAEGEDPISSSASAATSVDLSLQVRFPDSQRPLLRQTNTEVVEQPDGQPANRVGGSGKDFALKKTTTSVDITITVPRPGDQASPPLLKIQQTLKIDRSGATVNVTPESGQLHARLKLTQPNASGSIALDVDLMFLNVTDFVKSTVAPPLLSEQSPCDILILANTEPGGPETWIVAIPHAAHLKSGSANFLLYFRHEFQLNAGIGVSSVYDSPNSFLLGDGDWASQLEASLKPAILLMPAPRGTDFGIIHNPRRIQEVIQSLIVCLWGDGLVGDGETKALPSPKRFAIAGWSSGTEVVMSPDWLKTKLVSEIYCFDGTTGTKDNPGSVVRIPQLLEWVKENSDRKAVSIGTAYTEVASLQNLKPWNSKLGRREEAHPNIKVFPGSASFWYTDAGYCELWNEDKKFRRSTENVPGNPDKDMTTRYEIRLETDQTLGESDFDHNKASVTLSWRGNKGPAISAIANCEAAFRIDQIRGGNPIQTKQEFLDTVANVQKPTRKEDRFVFEHRHSWSVFGAQDFGGSSKGYLQICLEQSRF